MKKILVLSDSHGNFTKLLKIYEKENPDVIIYAGDGIKDIEELSYVHKNVYYIVSGNCDFFEKKYEKILVFEIEKVKFLLTHGHLYDVKKGLDKIIEISKNLNVDVTIYGHTHKEYLANDNKNYIFNPGASEDGKYGIIFIENESNIEFFHKKI